MAVLDAQVPVMHRVFVLNTGSGRHGSAQEGTLAAPVTRYAYQVYSPLFHRAHPDPINIEDLNRAVVELFIDVPDPTVYKKRDTVLINGIAFEVQGFPDQMDFGDNRFPFPEYDDMFGGTVHVRRVT